MGPQQSPATEQSGVGQEHSAFLHQGQDQGSLQTRECQNLEDRPEEATLRSGQEVSQGAAATVQARGSQPRRRHSCNVQRHKMMLLKSSNGILGAEKEGLLFWLIVEAPRGAAS